MQCEQNPPSLPHHYSNELRNILDCFLGNPISPHLSSEGYFIQNIPENPLNGELFYTEFNVYSAEYCIVCDNKNQVIVQSKDLSDIIDFFWQFGDEATIRMHSPVLTDSGQYIRTWCEFDLSEILPEVQLVKGIALPE